MADQDWTCQGGRPAWRGEPMAGDWIKMRTDLHDDPSVIGMACRLGIDEDAVVGKLHRIWSWADKQTIDGNAPTVTFPWVDRYLGVIGFAQAMADVDWLFDRCDCGNPGLRFPKFDRHNGQTAKDRALTAKRVHKCKAKSNAQSNAPTVTEQLPTALPREEKRREEKSKENTDTDGRKRHVFIAPTASEVMAYCLERRNGIDAEQFVAYYAARGWRTKSGPIKDWKACIVTWEKNKSANPPAAEKDEDIMDILKRRRAAKEAKESVNGSA